MPHPGTGAGPFLLEVQIDIIVVNGMCVSPQFG